MVATRIAEAVTAAGVHTVTPDNMSQIAVNSWYNYDGYDGPHTGERIKITSKTATTITATFAYPHVAGVLMSDLQGAWMWGT